MKVRMFIILFVAIAITPITMLADVINFGTRKPTKCTVVRLDRRSIEYVDSEGEMDSISLSRVENIMFSNSGIALLRSKVGTELAALVLSYENDKFTCKTAEGKDFTVSPSQLEYANFLGVSTFVKKLDVPWTDGLIKWSDEGNCSTRCVVMAAGYFKYRVSTEEVYDACGKKNGNTPDFLELEQGITNLGLITTGPIINPGKTEIDFLQDCQKLICAIEQERPVLLVVNQRTDKRMENHAVLLVGYDLTERVFYIHDPATKPNLKVSFDNFKDYRMNRYGYLYSIEFVGMGLRPVSGEPKRR
jgi:hypothetical protein